MIFRQEQELIVDIHLSDKQAEQLLLIYEKVNDPEVTSIGDYVEQLFGDLLSRIWHDVRNDILS